MMASENRLYLYLEDRKLVQGLRFSMFALSGPVRPVV